MGNTGELLFVNGELGLSAQGALNTFWGGDFLQARILTHRESDAVNNNLPEGIGNPTNTTNIVSTTNIDATSVPFSNIFADEFANIEGATAIASGFHLGTDGSDDTVYRFPGVTFGALYDVSNSGVDVGSCCFCADGESGTDYRDCIDYTNKDYCEAIGGKFASKVCIERYEDREEGCFEMGACCVNGQCTEASEEKCQKYGGFFIPDLSCGDVESLGGCPEPCEPDVGSCCYNNECISLPEYECSFFPNTIWSDKPCSETNCCLESARGACCIDETCFICSPEVCAGLISPDGSLVLNVQDLTSLMVQMLLTKLMLHLIVKCGVPHSVNL